MRRWRSYAKKEVGSAESSTQPSGSNSNEMVRERIDQEVVVVSDTTAVITASFQDINIDSTIPAETEDTERLLGSAQVSALKRNGNMRDDDIALAELRDDIKERRNQLSSLYSRQQELLNRRQALQEEMNSKVKKLEEEHLNTLTLELRELTTKYNQLKEDVCGRLRALETKEKELQEEYRDTLTFELCELTTKYELKEDVCGRLSYLKTEKERYDKLKGMHKKYKKSRDKVRREWASKMSEPLTEQQQVAMNIIYQSTLDDLESDFKRRKSDARNTIKRQKKEFELQQNKLLQEQQSLQNQLRDLRDNAEDARSAEAKLSKRLRTRTKGLEDDMQYLQNQLKKLQNQEELAKSIAKVESSKKMKEALELEKKIWDDERRSLLLQEHELQLETKTVQDNLDKLRDTMQHMLHRRNDKKTFRGGIPQLDKDINASTAHIPPESEHKPCASEDSDKFCLLEVPEKVINGNNSIWSWTNEKNILLYSTEGDIAHHVKAMLKEVSLAAGLYLDFRTDLGIRHITPNIYILAQGSRLVGVVEVKKPGQKVLEAPTVLGELYDQMKLLEGFYCSGPIVGIVTTLSQWRFAWFKNDNAHFEAKFMDTTVTSGEFLTPGKAEKATKDNPPGTTPSQKRENWGHKIEIDNADNQSDVILAQEDERVLITSPVIDAHENFSLLLRYLYSALIRVCQVQWHWRAIAEHPQCFFMLIKGDRQAITWYPANITIDSIQRDKFPRPDTTRLMALEDLGRGRSGKAWLMCTTSRAICVLKFGNKRNNGFKTEVRMWYKIYPEFKSMVRVDQWSGSIALMMPHFADIPVGERDRFRDRIEKMLRKKFADRNLYHNDVKWRNIGYYKEKKSGSLLPVLYDLESVQDMTECSDLSWIQKSMNSLFPA